MMMYNALPNSAPVADMPTFVVVLEHRVDSFTANVSLLFRDRAVGAPMSAPFASVFGKAPATFGSVFVVEPPKPSPLAGGDAGRRIRILHRCDNANDPRCRVAFAACAACQRRSSQRLFPGCTAERIARRAAGAHGGSSA
jgi:hypothetical protein